MEGLRWNPLKNEWLRMTRGVSFNDLTDQGKFLGTRHHPTRANQQIMLFEYQGRVWAVPFVGDRKVNFLKTLYPSRKYTKSAYQKDFRALCSRFEVQGSRATAPLNLQP